MSKWINRFKTHPSYQTLEKFIDTIDNFDTSEIKDPSFTEEFSRLSKGITYINTLYNNVDADLISIYSLNNINKSLNSSLSELQSYIHNKNIQHIINSNNHLDNVLNFSSSLLVYYKKPLKSDLVSIQESYQNVLDKHLKNYQQKTDNHLGNVDKKSDSLEERINNINEALDKLESEFKTIEQTIQAQTAEFNTQFQNSQNEKLNQFTQTQNELKEQIKKFKELSNKNEIDNTKQFEDWLEKTNEIMGENFVDLTTKSGIILNCLDKLKNDAENVFGVVQNTVQAGAHMQYANDEKKSANRYRFWAIILMLLSVSVTIMPELQNIMSSIAKSGISFDTMLKRIPISLIIFAPAVYLAKESTKHRKNETDNRKQELILRTIDPYLALIEDQKERDNLKGLIAQKIFSNDTTTNSIEQNDKYPNVVVPSGLISQLFKLKNNENK